MLLIFGMLLLPFLPHAQQLDFHSLSDEISLPASETYNVIQDSSGFIWFATEAGYCRYQRGKVEIFNGRRGIPEKSVYAAAVDGKGVLYVCTRDLRILCFDGEKFAESPCSETYRRTITKYWSYPNGLRFDGDNMYIYEPNRTVLINRSTNKAEVFQKSDALIECTFLNNGCFLFESKDAHKFIYHRYRFNFNGRITKLSSKEDAIMGFNPVFSQRGNKTAFSLYRMLWIFVDGKLVQSTMLPAVPLCMSFDRSGNLLVGLLNEGLYRYNGGNIEDKPLVSLSGLSVSGIVISSEGTTWCTTLEEGVFYCRNQTLLSYRNTPGLGKRILLLNETGGKLYSASNETAIYDIGSHYTKPVVVFSGRERISSILKDGNDYLLLAAKTQLVTSTGKRSLFSDGKATPASYGAYGANRSYIFVQYSGISFVTRSSFPQTVALQEFSPGRARGTMQVNDSLILAYGKNLVYVYNIRQRKEYSSLYRKMDYTGAVVASDGNIYLTTKSEGIFRYSLKTKLLEKTAFNTGNHFLFSIVQDKMNRFWLGTNTGALLMDSNWNEIADIGNLVSLPHVEVRLLKYFHDSIYFGTNEGLFALPAAIPVSNHKVYSPQLDYFLNRGKKFSTSDPDGWFGEITVKLLIPGSAGENTTFYILSDGETSRPIRFEGDKIVFSQLKPGRYQLQLYTVDEFGNKSRPLILSFTVAARFYQTWWFITLSGIAFVALVLLAYARTIRIIRKREARKTEISTQLAEFQMSALQAQMNPHFIFNAINTIQSYILTKNKDDAYRYLTKFSNLIRLVLHNSQEKFIPIVEELQVINTYLELEQARFSNFTYTIDIHPEIDIYETMIPAMLIQPYLENAIWHGLGHLTGRQGQLKLTIRLFDDYLQIEVRDNGIGRQAASKNKRSSHKSVGISITRQRLETLAQLNEGGIATVEVFDLSENGQATGTLVVIKVSLPDNS